ncbi:MAG: hypothetical protein HY898_01275 [Deltaproteobacteria bacterium]|nr:hypothetical protein [Deltaproteobacteria bacterium]
MRIPSAAIAMAGLQLAGCPGREPPRPYAAPAPLATLSAAPVAAASSVPSAIASAAPSAAPVIEPGPPRTEVVARKDFPCKGCDLRLPPTPDSARPAPLLVLLHGDLGDAWRMTRAFSAAAQSDGMILSSLRCPKDLGCKGSWWRWYLTSQHDPGWIEAQIAAIAKEAPVDAHRTYVAGYSGGASYLGYYVPTHPQVFAAASHVAGGVKFTSQCSTCKTPVHFLLGNQDPMIGMYTDYFHKWYEECGGHPMVWKILPGITHETIVGFVQTTWARQLTAWMLQYPLTCSADGQAQEPASRAP